MERNEINVKKYASFICTICTRENLKHLDPKGITTVIEYSSRLAEDQEKLSTWFANVADIIREANHYANEDNSKYIKEVHIEKALEEKQYRSNLIEQKIEEMIEKNIILVDTSNEKIGQINGLSVFGVGDFVFGKPSRITVSLGLGKKGIVEIAKIMINGAATRNSSYYRNLFFRYIAQIYFGQRILMFSNHNRWSIYI